MSMADWPFRPLTDQERDDCIPCHLCHGGGCDRCRHDGAELCAMCGEPRAMARLDGEPSCSECVVDMLKEHVVGLEVAVRDGDREDAYQAAGEIAWLMPWLLTVTETWRQRRAREERRKAKEVAA